MEGLDASHVSGVVESLFEIFLRSDEDYSSVIGSIIAIADKYPILVVGKINDFIKTNFKLSAKVNDLCSVVIQTVRGHFKEIGSASHDFLLSFLEKTIESFSYCTSSFVFISFYKMMSMFESLYTESDLARIAQNLKIQPNHMLFASQMISSAQMRQYLIISLDSLTMDKKFSDGKVIAASISILSLMKNSSLINRIDLARLVIQFIPLALEWCNTARYQFLFKIISSALCVSVDYLQTTERVGIWGSYKNSIIQMYMQLDPESKIILNRFLISVVNELKSNAAHGMQEWDLILPFLVSVKRRGIEKSARQMMFESQTRQFIMIGCEMSPKRSIQSILSLDSVHNRAFSISQYIVAGSSVLTEKRKSALSTSMMNLLKVPQEYGVSMEILLGIHDICTQTTVAEKEFRKYMKYVVFCDGRIIGNAFDSNLYRRQKEVFLAMTPSSFLSKPAQFNLFCKILSDPYSIHLRDELCLAASVSVTQDQCKVKKFFYSLASILFIHYHTLYKNRCISTHVEQVLLHSFEQFFPATTIAKCSSLFLPHPNQVDAQILLSSICSQIGSRDFALALFAVLQSIIFKRRISSADVSASLLLLSSLVPYATESGLYKSIKNIYESIVNDSPDLWEPFGVLFEAVCLNSLQAAIRILANIGKVQLNSQNYFAYLGKLLSCVSFDSLKDPLRDSFIPIAQQLIPPIMENSEKNTSLYGCLNILFKSILDNWMTSVDIRDPINTNEIFKALMQKLSIMFPVEYAIKPSISPLQIIGLLKAFATGIDANCDFVASSFEEIAGILSRLSILESCTLSSEFYEPMSSALSALGRAADNCQLHFYILHKFIFSSHLNSHSAATQCFSLISDYFKSLSKEQKEEAKIEAEKREVRYIVDRCFASVLPFTISKDMNLKGAAISLINVLRAFVFSITASETAEDIEQRVSSLPPEDGVLVGVDILDEHVNYKSDEERSLWTSCVYDSTRSVLHSSSQHIAVFISKLVSSYYLIDNWKSESKNVILHSIGICMDLDISTVVDSFLNIPIETVPDTIMFLISYNQTWERKVYHHLISSLSEGKDQKLVYASIQLLGKMLKYSTFQSWLLDHMPQYLVSVVLCFIHSRIANNQYEQGIASTCTSIIDSLCARSETTQEAGYPSKVKEVEFFAESLSHLTNDNIARVTNAAIERSRKTSIDEKVSAFLMLKFLIRSFFIHEGRAQFNTISNLCNIFALSIIEQMPPEDHGFPLINILYDVLTEIPEFHQCLSSETTNVLFEEFIKGFSIDSPIIWLNSIRFIISCLKANVIIDHEKDLFLIFSSCISSGNLQIVATSLLTFEEISSKTDVILNWIRQNAEILINLLILSSNEREILRCTSRQILLNCIIRIGGASAGDLTSAGTYEEYVQAFISQLAPTIESVYILKIIQVSFDKIDAGKGANLNEFQAIILTCTHFFSSKNLSVQSTSDLRSFILTRMEGKEKAEKNIGIQMLPFLL